MGSVLIRDQRAARAFPFRSPNISSYVKMRLFLEERKVMSKDKVKETAGSPDLPGPIWSSLNDRLDRNQVGHGHA